MTVMISDWLLGNPCPACQAWTGELESRLRTLNLVVCGHCGHGFRLQEIPALPAPTPRLDQEQGT